MTAEKPAYRYRWWRVMAGFVLAPLVPDALMASLTLLDGAANSSFGSLLALVLIVGGYPAALLFGLPLFLFLRARVRPRWTTAMIVGGLVAAIPWALVLLFAPRPDFALSGSDITVQNGVRTFAGWMKGLGLLGSVAALGAIGGLTFWLTVLGFTGRRETNSADDIPTG